MRTKLLLSTAAVGLMLASPLAFAQSNPDKKAESAKEQTETKQAPSEKRAQQKKGEEHKAAAADEKKAADERKPESSKGAEAQSEQQKHEKANSSERSRSEPKNSEANQQKASERQSKESADKNKQRAEENKAAKPNEKSGASASEQRPASDQNQKKTTNTEQQSAPSASSNQQREQQKNAASPASGEKNAQQNSTQQNSAEQNSNRQNQNQNAAQQNSTQTPRQQTTVNVHQLPQEKRVKISETISRERDIAPPVRNLNISVTVGTEVPQRIHLHRLPSEIVTIEPAYREYDYFTTEDDIVIVDPHTREIVTTIPRDVSAARAEQGSSTSVYSSSSAGASASASAALPCQVMRRDPSGRVTEVSRSELQRATTGSASRDDNRLAVTVQAPNGQSMPPIELQSQAGQIVVATDGQGDCKITLEPERQ